MESNDSGSRESRTCIFLRMAGVRESRKSFNLATQTLKDEDDSLLDLEILLNKTWNIYGVSILFGFKVNDEVQLKQYAKKLREEVASILSQEDVSYTAKVTVLDLYRPKETDHPIVQINVYAEVRSQEETNERSVYTGFLIAWHSKPVVGLGDNAIRLPLLLCRGTPSTMKAVHATLSHMFDCMVVSLPVNSEDLTWLLPIFLSPGGGQNTAKKTQEIKIEYTVPFLPTSNTINIKFLAKDLINMWKCIFEEKETIEAEEIKKFQQLIHTRILDLSNLELGLCMLNRLQLPSIAISGSKIKVMNVETMNTILTYFNEKALDAFHLDNAQHSVLK